MDNPPKRRPDPNLMRALDVLMDRPDEAQASVSTPSESVPDAMLAEPVRGGSVHGRDFLQSIHAQVQTLKQENTRLREALKFYADASKYCDGPGNHEDPIVSSSIIYDDGDIARAALKGE